MLQDMRALMPKGEKEGRLFLAHFVMRLPAKVSALLLATDVLDADDMAAAADRMVHIPEQNAPAISAVTEGSPSRCCGLVAAADRAPRSPVRDKGKKKRSQTPGPRDKKYCWYHWKFGKDSTRCQAPCKWEAEN